MISLMEILLKKEEYENLQNLQEAVNCSYPISAVLARLKFQGIEQNQIKVNKERNNFSLIFYNIKEYGDIKKYTELSDNLGWFISNYIVNLESYKPEDFDFEGLEEKNMFQINFKAKFDILIDNAPNILYHVTPIENWKKISQIGLVPKSQSKLLFHPSRIYLFFDVLEAKEIAQKLWNRMEEDKKNRLSGKFILLSVYCRGRENSPRLFKDQDYPNVGCFVMNNIKKDHIKKLQEFEVKR